MECKMPALSAKWGNSLRILQLLSTVLFSEGCKFDLKLIFSCSGKAIEDLHAFWKFQAAMIVTSVLAGLVVVVRMRKLDRDNAERIQRQISAL